MNPSVTREALIEAVECSFNPNNHYDQLTDYEKERVREAARTLSKFVPSRFWSDTHGCGCLVAAAFPEYIGRGCTDNMPEHLYNFGAGLADICGLTTKHGFDELIEVVD